METINTLINKAYRLMMQYDLKNGALSPNGYSQNVLNSIDITTFKAIENEVCDVMKRQTYFDEPISNPIQAATVFWFMEDLSRIGKLTPFIDVCNYDRLTYHYACRALQTSNNTEYWKFILIKVIIRYFNRFYKIVVQYSGLLMDKSTNNEVEREKFIDLILISLIESSGDLFFYTYPDLIEIQQVCLQKLAEKFRGENIDVLIKKGKENLQNLSMVIGHNYSL